MSLTSRGFRSLGGLRCREGGRQPGCAPGMSLASKLRSSRCGRLSGTACEGEAESGQVGRSREFRFQPVIGGGGEAACRARSWSTNLGNITVWHHAGSLLELRVMLPQNIASLTSS